jgi:hypothetical protein
MVMQRDPNFAYLLYGLLIFLLIGPIISTLFGSVDSIILITSYNAMLIVGIWSLVDRRAVFAVGIMLAAVTVSVSVLKIFYEHIALDLISMTTLLCFEVLSIAIVSQHIFSTRKVTLNLLIGSACVFLLLGMSWAILYMYVLMFEPDALSGLSTDDGSLLYWDMTYFSFVTLTTLGFGDINPISPLARALAYMEAVIGQIYTVVLIGVLVGGYMREEPPEKPG